jgi:putative transposase
MRNRRFTEAQIVAVLHEWEAGAKTSDLVRRHGVTEQTLYRWKKKYADASSAAEQRETRV